jgi:hypothetical protein
MLVSNMQAYPADGKCAVAIQPDHQEIGRLGARIILRDFSENAAELGKSFIQSRIEGVNDYYWLHLGLLERWEQLLDFRISDDVVNSTLCKGTYGRRSGDQRGEEKGTA